jgi:glycosyltransferase involved in cell wall biosynthesis
MRILAIEPYYGGSHLAFLDGWVQHSRHDWQLLTYSAHHWKWRVRHAAVSAAQWCNDRAFRESWDAVFCSSMLDLATWRGLLNQAPPAVVCYFHENQLTYPTRSESPRDLHYGFTNWTSSLAADAVWFNSRFHQDDWVKAVRQLLDRMPPPSMAERAHRAESKFSVQSPGIAPIAAQPRAADSPLTIVWAARWEHDKRPDLFLSAIDQLSAAGHDFRLQVLGQAYRDVPPAMAELRTRYARQITQWGLAPADQYREILSLSDVLVSTADHEFFGLATVEAMSAGCYPLLPARLSYPELLGPQHDDHLYQSVDDLVRCLMELSERKQTSGSVWLRNPHHLSDSMRRFSWQRRAEAMDEEIEQLAGQFTQARTAGE